MQKLDIPELNDRIIGWIYNESYRNLWKIRWYDFEDLVQDGLMIALKCRERYGDVEPAHFTALVKTAFHNHIASLQRTSGISEVHVTEFVAQDMLETPLSEQESFDTICQPILPDQELACTLSDLPEPIKAVLRLFLSPESLRRLRLPMRETLTDSETPAKRLKRLAGWPEDKDFASELEKRLFPG